MTTKNTKRISLPTLCLCGFWVVVLGFFGWFFLVQNQHSAGPGLALGQTSLLNTGWREQTTGQPITLPDNVSAQYPDGLTIVNTLPDKLDGHDYLMLRVYHQSLFITIDGVPRLEYSLASEESRLKSTMTVYQVLALSPADAGKEITIRYAGALSQFVGELSNIVIGPQGTLLFRIWQVNGPSTLLACLIFGLGLLFVVLSVTLRLRFRYANPLHYLGCFAAATAAWMISESASRQLYLTEIPSAFMMTYFTLCIATISLLLFCNAMDRRRHARAYYTVAGAIAVWYGLGTALHLTATVDYMNTLFGIHLLMVVSILLIGATLWMDRDTPGSFARNPSFLIGLSAFTGFAAMELFRLMASPMLPRGICTALGLLIFLVALGENSIMDLFRSQEAAHLALEESKRQSEKMADHVQNMQVEIIYGLANVIESRDDSTGGHVKRTSAYVALLAQQLHRDGAAPQLLTESYINQLRMVAPLHDIGKITIPDAILCKSGQLTDEEFRTIQQHTVNGKTILMDTISRFSTKEFVDTAVEIAMYHHERWDGQGYPQGLAGSAIPFCARIMAVADVFDALVSSRCYKSKLPIEKAEQIIREGRGTQFDPAVVDAFEKCLPQLRAVALAAEDGAPAALATGAKAAPVEG